MQNNDGVVYLIHFDTPYKHAQHYLGFTQNLIQRIAEHKQGTKKASRLMQVIRENNINWDCVRVWYGDRNFERKLKNQKNSRKLCPVCNKKVQP